MKLAFSSLGCVELKLGDIVKLALEYGCGGVELRGMNNEHVSVELSKRERKKIRAMFSGAEIEIISVTAYTRFAYRDKVRRRENEEELIRYLELAFDLGARSVRTFLGPGDEDIPLSELYDPIAESLMRVGEFSKGLPVKILLETHDRFSRVSHLKPVISRVERNLKKDTVADSRGIGILWDVVHSFLAGESLDESIQLINGRLGYVHLKDVVSKSSASNRPVYCIPGEGIIPFLEIKKRLANVGYSGYYCLEWERKWHPELPPIEIALRAFREIMH